MQCVSPLSQCSIYAPASVETGFWEPALVVANAMEFINVMLHLLLHELAQKIGTSKPYGCCNAADQHGSMSGARDHTPAAMDVSGSISSLRTTACRITPHCTACLCWRLQYNYLENIPGAYSDSTNNYQALSYSGDGNADSKLCGCQVCPDRPCGLGRSGPAPGPLKNDPEVPDIQAVSAGLESCGGSSGACMTINGRDCCIAVNSYQYSQADAAGTACSANCNNWFSAISSARPLQALWGTVQYTLPYTP